MKARDVNGKRSQGKQKSIARFTAQTSPLISFSCCSLAAVTVSLTAPKLSPGTAVAVVVIAQRTLLHQQQQQLVVQDIQLVSVFRVVLDRQGDLVHDPLLPRLAMCLHVKQSASDRSSDGDRHVDLVFLQNDLLT